MSAKESGSSDSELISWLDSVWEKLKKEYLNKATDEQRKKNILNLLAKNLRIYINSVRSPRFGIQNEYKLLATSKINWLQKQLINQEWEPGTQSIILAIQHAKRHTGDIAVEGSALRKTVSAKDRARLERLRKQAAKRYAASIGSELDEDDTRGDDLRSLGVGEHRPDTLDEASDYGRLDGLRNSDPEDGV